MSRLVFHWIDVFAAERFGGNPLAVFPDARGLDAAQMQRIAFELHLSETTFVLPSERPDCDVRVRIFTPHAELAMAGHPTVGTAFVLDEVARSDAASLARAARRSPDRFVFEEGVGPIAVDRVRGLDGSTLWRMSQPLPRFAPGPSAAAVAAALGLDEDDLAPDLPIQSVASGLPFLCVPLRSLDALARAGTSAERWHAIEREHPGALPYPFVRTGRNGARARMFAPTQGIAEDPATGSAAGPLGAYWLVNGLLDPGSDGCIPLTVVQGVEMGRPSTIHVEVDGRGRDVAAVRVAGACVPVLRGEIEA